MSPTTEHGCELCRKIPLILSGEAPDAVAELPTGVVVIGHHQFFYGYCLFIAKTHATELHQLPIEERQAFLWEMSLVSEAAFRAFRPRKMNQECLGNLHPHLHWHLFPRHAGDPHPNEPVWTVPKAIRESERARPSPEELATLRRSLAEELLAAFHRHGEPRKNLRLIRPDLSPFPSPPGDVFLLNGNKNPDGVSGSFDRPRRCGSASASRGISLRSLQEEAPPGSSDRSGGCGLGTHRSMRARRPGNGN